jgi:transcription elongation factor
MRRTTVTAAALAAGLLLTACSSGNSGGDTKAAEATTSSTPAASPSGTAITAECRAWIEGELLDSTDNIDATAGQAVCGDLSDEEMDQAIDDVTNDLMAEGAEPEDGPEEYGDGDYQVGTDIPAGTYESAGASSDGVGFCAITTEPTGSKLPQAKSAEAGERIIITLEKGDGVVSVQGCEPLTPR